MFNKLNVFTSRPQCIRTPQNLMTNNPDKVWPKGIVPYDIHRDLSEYARTDNFINRVLVAYFVVHQAKNLIYTCMSEIWKVNSNYST